MTVFWNSMHTKVALIEMTKMRKPIDDFFEGVMVMVQDEAVKNNRLALLDKIGSLFLKSGRFLTTCLGP